jgi:hypothetical protein
MHHFFFLRKVRKFLSTISTRKKQKKMDEVFEIAPEIKQALAEGRPVVALESTIISHGMPFPANLRTAQEVQFWTTKFVFFYYLVSS